MDDLRARISFQWDIRDCNILCLTETQLTPSVADTAVTPSDNFSVLRMDRIAKVGKTKGGGVCLNAMAAAQHCRSACQEAADRAVMIMLSPRQKTRFVFCNFEVFSFILVLENKRDCSPHKSALSYFCCIFCALSCTFMSLPVSCGVCSQFVSYLVQLVSLLYIEECFFSSL